MASIDPTLISDPKEHKWVVEINEILDHQLEINGETPFVSVFQVPETITSKKPEAYEPQHIGLGPFHHFRSTPYRKMEQQKLAVFRKVLQECEIEDGKVKILDKIRKLVPIVRSCYEMFIQDEEESLAWIFAIDGVFLFKLFQMYNIGMGDKEAYHRILEEKAYEYKHRVFTENCPNSQDLGQTIDEFSRTCGLLHPYLRQKEIVVTSENRAIFEIAIKIEPHRFQLPKFGTKRRKLVQDIMMVGNQIPFMVLKEIKEELYPSSGSFSPYELRNFCKIHSPLKLCPKSKAPTDNVDHVLHYMYCSIVNNHTFVETPVETPADESHKPSFVSDESWYRSGVGTIILDQINFISKVPKEEIVQVFDKTVSILETFTQTKILIPSASKLRDKAGFKFYSSNKHHGIQDIKKHDEIVHVPCLTLNNDSEVILRNLVAYETLTANPEKFPLTEYMGFMCALIVDVDDVKYLRDHNVIDGEMGDDQVAKLFTGMSTCIQPIKTKEKSSLQKVIDQVNMDYNKGLEMKMYLLLKKLAHWLLLGLKAIGKFVENSWKIVAFMVSIVTMFMLTYQAYCDVYGCDKKGVTLLPYASS